MDPDELTVERYSMPQYSYENWPGWNSWEAGAEIREAFPYYRSGYDNDGRVGESKNIASENGHETFSLSFVWFTQVYILEFGKWSYRALGQLSEERREEFWSYFAQLVLRTGRDAKVCNDQGVVYVDDFEGFSLQHYASKTGKS